MILHNMSEKQKLFLACDIFALEKNFVLVTLNEFFSENNNFQRGRISCKSIGDV